MGHKSFRFLLIINFLLSIFAVTQSSPIAGNRNHETVDGKTQKNLKHGIILDNQLMGTLTHLEKDPFEFSPRAVSNPKFSAPKHEVKVTSTPVKIYKTKEEYLKDMLVEKTRPTRKSYGSVIDAGPYQEPLSIAIPPLNQDYRIPSVSLRTPQHPNKIETNQEAVRRAYHLEDGFIPIVTNHGSALKVYPVQRGIPLNLAPPAETQESDWTNNDVITSASRDQRTRRKASVHDNNHHHTSVKTFTDSSKKHVQTIRGRRARKGKKRSSSSSNASKGTNSNQEFKPVVQQRRSKKFQPLNRSPRQQQTSSPPTGPLKIVTSNQIVQVSQEKDRRYHFEYTGENGVSRIEDGYLKNADSEKPIQVVKGSYSYIGPDDVVYTINYIADENGYRATGSHLPVSP